MSIIFDPNIRMRTLGPIPVVSGMYVDDSVLDRIVRHINKYTKKRFWKREIIAVVKPFKYNEKHMARAKIYYRIFGNSHEKQNRTINDYVLYKEGMFLIRRGEVQEHLPEPRFERIPSRYEDIKYVDALCDIQYYDINDVCSGVDPDRILNALTKSPGVSERGNYKMCEKMFKARREKV